MEIDVISRQLYVTIDWSSIDGLQSIARESNDKDVVAMLDELTIEANEESFVIIHQHGSNDVTCKLSIDQCNANRYQLTNQHRLVSIDRLVFQWSIFINCVRRAYKSDLVPKKMFTWKIPRSKTDYHMYSYFPRTIREWNSLTDSTVLAPNLTAFKKSLPSHQAQSKWC